MHHTVKNLIKITDKINIRLKQINKIQNYKIIAVSKTFPIEQILPFFQPEYTVTMKEIPELDIIRDVPIVLNSIGYEDDYEGDFTSRRSIVYTLSFTAKYYLYGPITSTNVIRTVQVDQYADTAVNAPAREQRYTVAPTPANAAATEFDPDDDNFGFNETTSFFEDAKTYDPETGTDV